MEEEIGSLEQLKNETIEKLREANNSLDTLKIERLSNLLNILLHYDLETTKRDELADRVNKLENRVERYFNIK